MTILTHAFHFPLEGTNTKKTPAIQLVLLLYHILVSPQCYPVKITVRTLASYLNFILPSASVHQASLITSNKEGSQTGVS